jgi:DNA-binding FrmR family transcriptional regulator
MTFLLTLDAYTLVSEDRYCVDIVTQIAAARAGLKRVSDELLEQVSR